MLKINLGLCAQHLTVGADKIEAVVYPADEKEASNAGTV